MPATPIAEPVSAHPLPAIDVEALGDDVVGFLGRQEDGHAGQVLGFAHAPERNLDADFLLLLAGILVLELGKEAVHPVPMLAIDHTRAMALTLMPCLIRSRPADCVNEIIAALVAQ